MCQLIIYKGLMGITQQEYDFLMRLDKSFADLVEPIQLGPAPLQWVREINATSSKENFLLDFYRGNFELSKFTINKRYRNTIILLRYDNGGRHTNPDGVILEGPHVHLYREGYNDKFAFPIAEVNANVTDTMQDVFNKIMHFCNISQVPTIQVPMF